MEKLIDKSERILRSVNLTFCRYLLDIIDWNERLIAIRGARGTVKTTMMLQHIKKNKIKNTLYVSLDDLYFTNHTLTELADHFVLMGGQHLYLDEVHKYPGWSKEIKNLYDSYPDLSIVFSSSSALQIDKGEADLSRRSVKYTLQELSFREYLALTNKTDFDVLTLKNILENHNNIASTIARKIVPVKLFHEYLQFGCYPFIQEGKNNYLNKIRWSASHTVETDLPAIEKMTYETVIKLKKLLMVIGASVPFKPNITDLSQKIGTSRDQLLKFLWLLNNAGLLQLLRQNTLPSGYLTKPEKIYLNNSSLFYALSEKTPEIGALRETFFMNQVANQHLLHYSGKADFLVDRKFLFEVGGANKTNKQIKGSKNSFVVSDNIETGYGNHIPLWLFGFLY